MSDIAISHGMVHNVEYDEQAKRVIKALCQDFKRFEGHKNTPSTFKIMCQSMNAIVERIVREYPPTLCPGWAFKYENEEHTGRVTLHVMHAINGIWEYAVDPTFKPDLYEFVDDFQRPEPLFKPFTPIGLRTTWRESMQEPKKDDWGNLK